MAKRAAEDLYCSKSLNINLPSWTERINAVVRGFQAPLLMIHSEPWESSLDTNNCYLLPHYK